jgi:hypothetical protein
LSEDVLIVLRSELSPTTTAELFPKKDPIKQSNLAKLVARQHLTTIRVRRIVNNDRVINNQPDTETQIQIALIIFLLQLKDLTFSF